MGLFSGIKDNYKKSEAAVVVQKLLEIQANAGMLSLPPAGLATKLVDAVWSERPAVFGGKYGQRPFKMSVAATALANGVLMFEDEMTTRNALLLSLGNIFLR